MPSKLVENKDGAEKLVVADSAEALAVAVKVAQSDQLAVGPDIDNPKDGNKVVSPDNLHTNAPVEG